MLGAWQPPGITVTSQLWAPTSQAQGVPGEMGCTSTERCLLSRAPASLRAGRLGNGASKSSFRDASIPGSGPERRERKPESLPQWVRDGSQEQQLATLWPLEDSS